MELLIFGYGGPRVLVFPTRGGRFYEYENLGLVERLQPFLETGQVQLFCVDGIDTESFYCWWAHPQGRIERHLQYERYLLEEVFPLMELKNPRESMVAHGCSLGAFHAANLVLRHPARFDRLVAFSGRYDLTIAVEQFRDLFDGHYSDEVYFNTPCHFLPGLECPDRLAALRRLDISIVIGAADPFLPNNLFFSRLLWSKGIAHRFHTWEGRAHSARSWREMAPWFLTPPAIAKQA